MARDLEVARALLEKFGQTSRETGGVSFVDRLRDDPEGVKGEREEIADVVRGLFQHPNFEGHVSTRGSVSGRGVGRDIDGSVGEPLRIPNVDKGELVVTPQLVWSASLGGGESTFRIDARYPDGSEKRISVVASDIVGSKLRLTYDVKNDELGGLQSLELGDRFSGDNINVTEVGGQQFGGKLGELGNRALPDIKGDPFGEMKDLLLLIAHGIDWK